MSDASGPVDRLDLAAFNQMAAAGAERVLLGCCSSPSWAGRLLAGRPYPATTALLAASDAVTLALTEPDLADALAGHPRLGGRPGPGGRPEPGARPELADQPGQGANWSALEQSALGSDEADRRELSAGNDAYERRFGHIYLACATGRTAAELVALLRSRLGNEPAAEWDVVRSELAKINRIRLLRLTGGVP